MTLDDLARLAQLIKLSGETVNDLAKLLPTIEPEEVNRLGSAVQEAANQLLHLAARSDAIKSDIATSDTATSTRGRLEYDPDRVGYAITNFTGRFIGASEQFLGMVGLSSETLYSSTILEITHEQDRLRNYELLENLRNHARSFTIRKRYKRPDASLIWVENDVLRLTDETGEALILARSRPLVSG